MCPVHRSSSRYVVSWSWSLIATVSGRAAAVVSSASSRHGGCAGPPHSERSGRGTVTVVDLPAICHP